MNRIDMIGKMSKKLRPATYLEIGVFRGKVFLQVKIKRKIAVDPEFRISRYRKIMYFLKNPHNMRNRYFQMTSDDFFRQHAQKALAGGLGLAFVDGLHTYAQAYRDVMNCLKYLTVNGAILLHDCNPPHAAAALQASSRKEAELMGHPEWNGEWTGDVFKALLRLRSERKDLDICVVDCDYGVGIVRKGEPESRIDLRLDEIEKMTYDDFAGQRRKLLNLKNINQFKTWTAT